MVLEIKVNQFITVALISAKRFKNIIFRLFAVSSFKKAGYSEINLGIYSTHPLIFFSGSTIKRWEISL